MRAASDATGRAVGVLADLQGPKIRLGRFADGPTYWANGETVRITVDDCPGNHDRVSTTYKQLAADAAPGDRVLVDDGKVGLVVEHIDGDDVVCTVTEGGPVSNHKGISLPGMNVSAPALSAKDIEDLEFALRPRRRHRGAVVRALAVRRGAGPRGDGPGRPPRPGDRQAGEAGGHREPRSRGAGVRRGHGGPR